MNIFVPNRQYFEIAYHSRKIYDLVIKYDIDYTIANKGIYIDMITVVNLTLDNINMEIREVFNNNASIEINITSHDESKYIKIKSWYRTAFGGLQELLYNLTCHERSFCNLTSDYMMYVLTSIFDNPKIHLDDIVKKIYHI